MRAAILQDIIARTDALDAPSAAKEQFKRLVRQMGSIHGVSSMARTEHIEFARHLLLMRVARPMIRDRLIALFAISRSQAYNVIQEALNCPE